MLCNVTYSPKLTKEQVEQIYKRDQERCYQEYLTRKKHEEEVLLINKLRREEEKKNNLLDF